MDEILLGFVPTTTSSRKILDEIVNKWDERKRYNREFYLEGGIIVYKDVCYARLLQYFVKFLKKNKNKAKNYKYFVIRPALESSLPLFEWVRKHAKGVYIHWDFIRRDDLTEVQTAVLSDFMDDLFSMWGPQNKGLSFVEIQFQKDCGIGFYQQIAYLAVLSVILRNLGGDEEGFESAGGLDPTDDTDIIDFLLTFVNNHTLYQNGMKREIVAERFFEILDVKNYKRFYKNPNTNWWSKEYFAMYGQTDIINGVLRI